MNLLFVTTDFPPDYGGISTYSKEISENLSRKCHVTVLAPGCHTITGDHCENIHKIIRTPAIPLMRLLAFGIYLPYLLWRYRFDAVLHAIWTTALISHLFYPFFKVPYFVSVYASEILDDKSTLRRRVKSCLKSWRKAAMKSASGIFPISKYTAGLLDPYGLKPDRVVVINCGVDPKRFKPKKIIGTNRGAKTLLTVARLDLHKGHDSVLHALAILKKQGIVPNYHIVGQGEELSRLREISRNYKLEGQVVFMGFLSEDQLVEAYQNADIFIMVSREIPGRPDIIEGFGIAFLEASASGLPVIAGNCGGVPDAVKDGKTGLLVDSNDPNKIAESIKSLLENQRLCETLGNEGRKWTESEMNWKYLSERMSAEIMSRI